VSFNLTVQIDPYDVLGVVPGASLQEIREAYRRKAKQHHPDVGGETWAFRILSQSYEIVSTARVARASEAEFHARPHPSTQSHTRPHSPEEPSSSARGSHSGAEAGSHAGTETIRPGVHDAGHDPAKIVDVEKLWVRFEVDHMWLLQEGNREDRFLSCCLNVSWPRPELASRAGSLPDAEETLQKLSEAFEAVHIHTPVVNSRCKVEENRFQGWLSYSTTQLAWSAFNVLHDALNARGLGVHQWTRDLIIPRDWR
jgi:hypothetical protein